MPHHFLKNTTEASAWCSVCNRYTMHSVWSGRLGSCKEQHRGKTLAEVFAEEKPKQDQQSLFDKL